MADNAQRARIEAMKREIERRGGIVGIDSGIPDDVLEIFLAEILECPCCNGDGEDGDDLEPFVPKRRAGRGH